MKLPWSEAEADPDTLHRINALLQDIRRNRSKDWANASRCAAISAAGGRAAFLVYRARGAGDEQLLELWPAVTIVRPAGDS